MSFFGKANSKNFYCRFLLFEMQKKGILNFFEIGFDLTVQNTLKKRLHMGFFFALNYRHNSACLEETTSITS